MKIYYTVLILAFVAIAGGEYFWLSRAHNDIKMAVTEQKKAETASFIQTSATGVIQPEDFSQKDVKKQQRAFEDFWKIIQAKGFIRMKVWDKNFTVLWSDLPELIGQRFPDNDEVAEALDGEVELELTDERARTSEYFSERQYQNLLEIYVPILDASGKPAGVLETYQPADSFLAEIQASFRRPLLLRGGLGIAVFIVFFLGLRLFLKKRGPLNAHL